MHRIYERHLHPSVYQKFNKTRKLKEEGVNPGEFRKRGGLDEKTYEALIQRWKRQKQLIDDREEKIISKYGSLKAAPLSAGPCKKIDPVIGTKNALVLLTEFKDKKHTYQPDDMEKFLFSKGSRGLRDYYLEASWNQLDITGKVSNRWYTTYNNCSDYIDEAVEISYPYARMLVKETVLKAKNSGDIDFAQFAVEGKIELLIVVFAGKGLDTTLSMDYIRPHQGKLSEPIEVQDGIVAERYCLVPELDNVGCYCHEVGHLLGLPDFYNMKSPVVGGWCVMSIGDHIDEGKTPTHPSAWCKVHLGWTVPKQIDKPPEIHDIPAVQDKDGVIYKIEVHGSGGREYYLLENRQQKGFDEKLPGNGLLIWHVNENRCAINPPNNDFNNLFLTLIQSDGGDELQKDITSLLKEKGYDAMMKEFTGDDGDPYPGITSNRNFDSKSNPRSVSKKGTDSLARVTGISDSTDVMRAHMGVDQSKIVEVDKVSEASQLSEIEADKIRDVVEKRALMALQNFITLMTAETDEKPYDKGYEAAKQDIIQNLKDNHALDTYITGYRVGYREGYQKASKERK